MKRILVIEDNTDVRENIAELLSLSGYEAIEAENGKVGVKKAQNHPPDLIMCDVMMPELDGFGVLRILNRDPVLMHIPFMFLTAKAEKADFRRGMGLGADDYITKPFDDVELLDAIEMRLKKSTTVKSTPSSEEGLKQLYDVTRGDKGLLGLSSDREIRRLQTKDTIYSEHQWPRWVYFVKSGSIKCYRNNDMGKELISQIIGPGEWLGYLSVLQNQAYSDHAEALAESEIILIPVDDFRSLLYNNKDVAARLLQMLAHRADLDESKLVELAYSSVRKKVANAILSLTAKSNGPISIMREDLASLAGTAKESTIRMISDLRQEGVISTDNGEITILDLAALQDMHQ